MNNTISKMNVLITGSSGLVGSALRNTIENNIKYNFQFIYLTSKDGNLTKENDVKKIFEKYKPIIVVHLAANVGGLYKNMHNKAEMFEDNVLMNTYILKYSRLFNVEKIINILSTCIFPDNIQITEYNLHDGPPHTSNYGYAYAKRMLDVHSCILFDCHEIKFINLIPTNLYGFNDNFNIKNAHVIPALIHKCYNSKISNSKFVISGTGSAKRQFLYVDDFAKMIFKAIIKNIPSGNYICSPPKEDEISINEVAKLISKYMKYENGLYYDTKLSDGQYNKTVTPSKIFGDIKITPIEEGLKNTVSWFLDNYDYIRK